MNYSAAAKDTLDIEIRELQRVRDALNTSFDQAVDLILDRLRSGGKIILTGVGKNLPIAQKIAATLTSTGSPAIVLDPSSAMHGDLGIVLPSDVVLALSYSGASDELLSLIPSLRRIGIGLVAVTGEPDGPLAGFSDALIGIRVEREACPFNLAPTASTTATLAIGDALAMTLLAARGFAREDFARLHPGGAIGRTLLLKVSDIMRSGDRLACVEIGARVADAVNAMTRARSGAVAIVDKEKTIRGIFTDGDLRRHLSDPGPVGERPIADLMTPDPVVVEAGHLAAEVLRLFEQHAIDDLLVVDEKSRLVGMVDLQDLPKMKIL